MSGFGFGFGFGFAQQATNVNPLPDGVITTVNGETIVLTTGGDYILTVNGWVPAGALKTLSGEPVKTLNNDFILT